MASTSAQNDDEWEEVIVVADLKGVLDMSTGNIFKFIEIKFFLSDASVGQQ
jgi:hypothetical protein